MLYNLRVCTWIRTWLSSLKGVFCDPLPHYLHFLKKGWNFTTLIPTITHGINTKLCNWTCNKVHWYFGVPGLIRPQVVLELLHVISSFPLHGFGPGVREWQVLGSTLYTTILSQGDLSSFFHISVPYQSVNRSDNQSINQSNLHSASTKNISTEVLQAQKAKK